MKSVIREIYLDNCGFLEKIKSSKKYKEVDKQFQEVYEKLSDGLTEKQTELLDELAYLSMGLEAEHGETYFIVGFKLGLRLCAEALT